MKSAGWDFIIYGDNLKNFNIRSEALENTTRVTEYSETLTEQVLERARLPGYVYTFLNWAQESHP